MFLRVNYIAGKRYTFESAIRDKLVYVEIIFHS